jgi:hypothetical protein
MRRAKSARLRLIAFAVAKVLDDEWSATYRLFY